MIEPASHGLTQDTFVWLKQHKAPETKQDIWYRITYPIFIQQRVPQTKEEFYYLMALVYSWMPRIPTVTEINAKEWMKLFVNLEILKNDDSILETLLNQMIPLVNNSIVGSSKILHIIYPSLIPIIDIGVVENWNIVFKENKELILSKVHLNSGDIKQKTALFIKYRNWMLKWKENCGQEITIRNLESALFNFQPNKDATI